MAAHGTFIARMEGQLSFVDVLGWDEGERPWGSRDSTCGVVAQSQLW